VGQGFDYEQLTEANDSPRIRDVLFQTLNVPLHLWNSFADRIGLENFRVLREDGRIIGGLGMYRMGQWFGGRRLASAGIALVGVAPERRAQGAAAHLMASLLRELYDDGTPLSTLYPSTQRLYRKVGYEPAGSQVRYELPISSIGLNDHTLSIHQASPTDRELFDKLAHARAKLTNGNLDRTQGLWQRIFSVPDKTVYAYLIGEPNEPQGYIIYYQDEQQSGPFHMQVRDMLALTPAAGQRLWTFLADHRSVAESVIWYGPANEPLLNLTSEYKVKTSWPSRWMLRIVDVKRALAERGYPLGVEGALHLEIRDDLLPANQGKFVLTVADGAAEVREGGRGDLRIDIRGLSPLYSGFFTPAILRTTGQLEANDRALSLATQIFAGPEPWMTESF
jgi:predicted acetyltransferase